MSRELRDVLRWLVTGRSLPEAYYVHAIELEELRADLSAFSRSLVYALALVAAAAVAGYLGAGLR